MNGLVRQRARLARVRRIQHGLAATVAAQAAGRVQMLETSRERLRQMRSELRPAEGPTTGAAMARMGELAMRLDSARHNLGPTIDSARSAAAAREGERRAARRDQESAEKLEAAAMRVAEELAEQRLRQAGRGRARLHQGESE
jgi:type II secretory pathway component HofQ